MRVSSTCLVRVDPNRYSLPASAAGKTVLVRATADQIRVVADGELIAAHPRSFERDQLVCDPWHVYPSGFYLSVLEKKLGAVRRTVCYVGFATPDTERARPYF